MSGQLNVEAYCLALTKAYTFGPTFRAENSNGSLAISDAPRRRSCAPDDGGRARLALFQCAASARTIGHVKRRVVDALTPAFNSRGRVKRIRVLATQGGLESRSSNMRLDRDLGRSPIRKPLARRLAI